MSASRRHCCVLGWAGLQSSGAQTEVARCDSGLVQSEVRRLKYRPFAFRGGLIFLQKLTSASMQSESGIVPDFEVGEEFQEEPKTYYELKSQPLKSRSVLEPRTVISHAVALLVFGGQLGCTFSKCCPESVRVPVSSAAADLFWSWSLWSGSSSLAAILLASLCNAWVLSCQHQLQILACGTAHWSVRGADDVRVPYKILFLHLHLKHVAVQMSCRTSAFSVCPIYVVFMCSSI